MASTRTRDTCRPRTQSPPSGCKGAGYKTAAFVSSFVLSQAASASRAGSIATTTTCRRRAVERSRSSQTTDRALAQLKQARGGTPLFLWVHYFDPHTPYVPAGAVRAQYREAAVSRRNRRDGRAARPSCRGIRAAGPRTSSPSLSPPITARGSAIMARAQHGNLLYQSTMHVPLVVMGRVSRRAVERRAGEHTAHLPHAARSWAGCRRRDATACAAVRDEVVLGEAMKPFLELRLAAADHGRRRATQGDLRRHRPRSTTLAPIARRRRTSASRRQPAGGAAEGAERVSHPFARRGARPRENLNDEARRSLASLGYVSATRGPVVRKDAPRPADMVEAAPTRWTRRPRCSSRSGTRR